jgi:hypothetical protein
MRKSWYEFVILADIIATVATTGATTVTTYTGSRNVRPAPAR